MLHRILLSFFFLLAWSSFSYEASEYLEGGFLSTSFFNVVASSTCGEDTPPENTSTACVTEDHTIEFASDGNLNTWWQSEYDDDPATINFTLKFKASLELTGIRLHIRSPVPALYIVSINDGPLNNQYVFVANTSMCSQHSTMCTQFTSSSSSIELVHPNFNTELLRSMYITVFNNPTFSAMENFHTIAELEIYTRVARGHFTRSLSDIQVEAEIGTVMRGQTPPALVERNSSSLDFPGYSGRGYAIFNVPDSERVIGQWIIPSLPQAGQYQILIFYINKSRKTRRLDVTIYQNGHLIEDLFVDVNGSCMRCLAAVSTGAQNPQPYNLNFTSGMLTIDIVFNSVDLLVDVIVVIPSVFSEFKDLIQTSVNSDAQMSNTTNNIQAQQLSLEFYRSTFSCDCGSSNSTCEAIGGQCPCQLSTLDGFTVPTGRQCDQCSLTSYLTVDGCSECSCPSASPTCELSSGQCEGCPNLAFGPMCERCIINSYLDNGTCTLCDCHDDGTSLCNNGTGECICKNGVGGARCDECRDSFFNFSMDGCVSCNCAIGSVNDSCDNTGACSCSNGVTGQKCTQCSDGYFALSQVGCRQCSCSNRTNNCQLSLESSLTNPQENCTCPHPYTGLSCQTCLSGYFMSSVTLNCEPCQCNGQADSCLDGSGECINCRNQTSGSSCESCVEGTYDADPSEALSCQPCPCSTVTTINSSCLVVDSVATCYCRHGHEGPQCSNCSNGFFGSPPVTACSDCTCNGNIDSSSEESCDPLTGECLACTNNAAGAQCEVCKDGFYGDATTQSCQSCSCNVGGSSSELCHQETGQCSCLEQVSGRQCNLCQVGSWNFTAGIGCENCSCGAASENLLCDSTTGQCSCLTGATGRECSICADGFYNLTAGQGCSNCGCSSGAINGSCSNNGTCYCLEGVTGLKCDQCLPFYHSLISSVGCQRCSSCEVSLREQIQSSANLLSVLESNIIVLQQQLMVDSELDTTLQSYIALLSSRPGQLMDDLSIIEQNLRNLNETSYQNALEVTQTTTNKVIQQLQRTVLLLPYAQRVHRHVITVHNMMQDLFNSAGDLDIFTTQIQSTIATHLVEAQKIAGNISSVNGKNLTNVSSAVTRTILRQINITRESLARLEEWQSMQLRRANIILEESNNYTNILSSLNLQQLHTLFLLYNGSCEAFINLVSNLENSFSLAERERQLTMARANESEYILARVGSLLIVVQTDIDGLFSLNNDLGMIMDNTGSGTNEGSKNGGLGSGSGTLGSGNMELGSSEGTQETQTARIMPMSTIPSLIQSLAEDTDQLKQQLLQQSDYLMTAANISRFYKFAEALNMTLIPALGGSNAAESLMNYSQTLRMLEIVCDLSNITSSQLDTITELFTMTTHESRLQHINQIVTVSGQLLSESEIEHENVRSLHDVYQTNLALASTAMETENSANKLQTDLMETYISHSRNVSALSAEINNILATSDSNITSSWQIAVNSISELPQLTSSSQNIIDQTRITEEKYNNAAISLDYNNSSLQAISNALEDNVEALANANVGSLLDMNQAAIDNLNISLFRLSAQIEDALAAAEMIDIAIQFGESSLSYVSPRSFSDQLQSVSLAIKPSEANSGTIFSSRSAQSQFSISQVANGSLQFECNQETTLFHGGALVTEEWYQIYATRTNEKLKLSLSSFPQNGSSYKGTAILNTPSCSLIDDIIYVGGTSGSAGCIDRVKLNGYSLPLLIPREINKTLSTCGIRPPLQNVRDRENGVWLMGSGSYINMGSLNTNNNSFSIGFLFRTYSAECLLFTGFSNTSHQYITISLNNGRLQVHSASSVYDDILYLSSNSTYNSGAWYQVVVTYQDNIITVEINGTVFLSEQLVSNFANSFQPLDQSFIGGVSEQSLSLLPISLPTIQSMAGCIHQFQVNDTIFSLLDRESYRSDYNGCPIDVVSGIRFNGEGRVNFNFDESNLTNIFFNFRTTQVSAFLLRAGNLTVSLFHSRIKVQIYNNGILSSILSVEANLGTNTHQSVTLNVNSSNAQATITLTVSGGIPVNISLPIANILLDRVLIGGSQEQHSQEMYRGCMSNVTVNGRLVDFNTANLSYGVSLYGCHPPSHRGPVVTPPTVPPPPPPLPPPPAFPTIATQPVGFSGMEGSFLSFRILEQQVISSFSIILEFMTSSSHGLLLFMQDNIHLTDFLALQLNSGQLLFSFNLGSGSAILESRQQYNDGGLHRVELVRSGRHGQMVINNGTEIISGLSNGSFQFLNARSEYMFIGGLPQTFNRERLRLLAPYDQLVMPILACVSTFAINGVFLNFSMPQVANDIQQCQQQYTNLATLGNNSYIQFFDNFDVGVGFGFTINFMTTNCSGLILYAASTIYSDHLLVELRSGQVILVFDNGPQVEMVVDTSSNVCDGNWHSLEVTKTGQRGSVSVDGGVESVVISQCDSCMHFTATNTNGPLYVGGLPDMVKPRHSVSSNSFHGCLSNFNIRSSGQEYMSALFSQAVARSNVQLDECNYQ